MVLYRHLKLNGEVFYIGIGSKQRSKSKIGRNKYWKEIVNNEEYIIEILYENLTYEEANDLEKLLISFYGRKNLNTGTLVNLTDGGSGTIGRIFTKEHKEKLSKSQEGFLNHRFGKEGVNKNKKRGSHPASKKVIHNITGQIWDCVQDCCDELNLKYESLVKKLRNVRKNNTNLEYLNKNENN